MAEPPRMPPELFRFATTERADLHTAVLHAFAAAARRLETALTPAGLRALLPAGACGERDLAAALRRLTVWGLLDVVFDHGGGFGTAEAYRRESIQYALTPRGEAALAGLRHATAALSSSGPPSGALHAAVLDAIAERLRELADLLRDPDPGRDRRVFTALRELERHFDDLRTDAGRFTADLRRLLRPGEPMPDADVVYLRETVAYLQEYVTDLDQRRDAVTRALEAVAAHDVHLLHTRALTGAGLPPSRVNLSPFQAGQDSVAAWLEERAVWWEALRAWFGAEDGGARRLYDQARQAVVALLESLDRIAEARSRPVGAAADFRTLARWFAAAPTEEDAHRLWDAAFGLGPARHAHLGHADAELVPAGVPWARAEPVEVSALLRARGRTERVGRTGKVRDVTALRAERRARAARERAALEAAWSSLTTTSSTPPSTAGPASPSPGGPSSSGAGGLGSSGAGEPGSSGAVALGAAGAGGAGSSGTGAVRLSRLGELDHDGLGRLLDLLGRALAERPDSTGFRRAITADGRIEIVLRDPEDGAMAELRTPEGCFRAPDYLIDLRTPGHGREATPTAHGRAVGA
ncbi:TIGR02677 family protein [Nonomuraea bangladeshensis]|uniref:TIGR02677 family protein n=1 Tax=Nonomuraea bangladeshensis TaxID=404385 RepID=UPI003C2B85E7